MMTQAPALIRRSGPIASRLLRAGMPMGPNLLLTVRGRTSGQPRTAPVAVVNFHGRRWVVGTFGEVHWVRNLRAAGEAEVGSGGRSERVHAIELNHEESTSFFSDVVPAYLASLPIVWRLLTRVLLRFAAPEILTKPARAADLRPVFELREGPASSAISK